MGILRLFNELWYAGALDPRVILCGPCEHEYTARFIMGQVDPNNDADWNKYIDTLKKLGLDELKKIRTDAYNRANK